jgi:hypothetical protein
MIWLNPAALAALALVAGPIVVHLLRSRRAPRVGFPSLRFFRPSRATSVRLRLPSDWRLLVVRCAVVALAVLALAQPLLLTPSRIAAWNRRTARAVVVDGSGSMARGSEGSPAATSDASAVAAAELQGAFLARQFDAPDLTAGVASALAWLETVPPARQEIVLISDFHEGAIDDKAIAALPSDVGLRTVVVGRLPANRTVDGIGLIGVEGQAGRRTRVELTAGGTRARFEPSTEKGQVGLIVLAGPDEHSLVAALMRAVAAAGAPAPAATEPIVVRFGRSESEGFVEPTAFDAWMLRTVLRMSADRALRRGAAAITAAAPLADRSQSLVVLRDRHGQALLRASAGDRGLILEAAVDVSSYFAAQLVRGALVARQGAVALPEDEVRPAGPRQLAIWNRPGADVSPDRWRRAESSDARWGWLAALALLAFEQWLRRNRQGHAAERHDVAA